MSKLRLGPIVEEKPVKMTVELPGSLFRDLVDYTQVHAQETGLSMPLPPERLIAPMLARFMGSDRGFLRRRKEPAGN